MLRGPLTGALKDVQQDQDRPRTFAAAEAMSGLLASSSSYAGRPALTLYFLWVNRRGVCCRTTPATMLDILLHHGWSCGRRP